MLRSFWCKWLRLPSPFRGHVNNSVFSLASIVHNVPCEVNRLFSSAETTRKRETANDVEKTRAFVLSYLVNRVGLPLESAKVICSRGRPSFSAPGKPDSVLEFLRSHGFRDTDIARIVRSTAKFLAFDVKKTLAPKFEFFKSIGFSSDEIIRIVTVNPNALGSSLNQTLIPCFNFLKSVFGREELVRQVYIRTPHVVNLNWERDIAPKFSALSEIGVPEPFVMQLLTYRSRVFGLSNEKFQEKVKKITDMGFEPRKAAFTVALSVFCQMKESTLDQKVESFKKWGWSEDEVWAAFRRNPHLMRVSENQIGMKMDFLLNKMGWKPTDIWRCPSVLNFGLEKKIIPWCSVLRLLQLKGLIKEENPVCSVLVSSNYFLRSFVMKYLDQAPELMGVYEGKISLQHLGLGFRQ